MTTTKPSRVAATTWTATVVVGSHEHGVVRHATAVAYAAGTVIVEADRPDDVDLGALSVADVVHIHFTDRLFGADATSAARRFRQLVDGADAALVVSVHDVPEIGDDDRDRRRADAYRNVCAAASAVVAASRTECLRLREIGVDGVVDVIPLPVVRLASDEIRICADGDVRRVAVLGFVYPGKGHDDVIAAAASLDRDIEVVALGAPSDGHESLVAELAERARRAGGCFSVTGHLPGPDLAKWLGRIDVPVVPARAPSASASLNTWIAAGRRPLVAAGPYTQELLVSRPELATLYPAGDAARLADNIEHALAEPDMTWRTAPVPHELTLASVADAHRAVFARVRRHA